MGGGVTGSLGCRGRCPRAAGPQGLGLPVRQECWQACGNHLLLTVRPHISSPGRRGWDPFPHAGSSPLIPLLVAGFRRVHWVWVGPAPGTRGLELRMSWRRPPEGPWVVGLGWA